MKKIVRGNDFMLKVPVRKMVDGGQVRFPLPACTDIVVNLVNAYRRTALPYGISAEDDSVIEARVESAALALGSYALEGKGRMFGAAWRSNEYEQIVLVDNNAAADTELSAADEGEDSVEMDTAIVVLPPTEELEQLVSGANAAMERAEQLGATLTATDAAAKAAENARETAEAARAATEKERAAAEDEREAAASAAVERCRAAAERAEGLDVRVDGAELGSVS